MSGFEMEKSTGDYALTARKIRSNIVRKEVGTDFVLPDYMGDIKRMLKYNAYVTPCNKLVTADEASFLAVVTFRVVYLDSEDTLTEAVFTQDCEIAEKALGNLDDADVGYKVQSVALKLGGPRKISAKATVGCDISFVETEEICERSEYDGAEALKKEIEVHTAEYLKCAEREYAEEIDKIDEKTTDDVEVVKSFAEAFIDGVHKTDGGVNLSGYVDAFCILRSDDGIVRIEKRIPVEEHVECQTYDESAFIPMAYVTGVNVNLNNVNNDDECSVSVVMNMTVECTLAHHYNEKISVTLDAFYKGCKNECIYESYEYAKLGECIFDKAFISTDFERGESALTDIIEKELTLKNTRYDVTGTDVLVTCDAELHVIARGNSMEDCYPIKHTFELSKKYKLPVKENTKLDINAIPCDVSVTFDSEKMYVEAQVLISALAQIKENEKILKDIEYEEKTPDNDCSVIVYYPEKDDTLWSVSKKYGVSPSALAQKNGIAGNEELNLSKIIIVK
ncbi:MAG: LysM peptidoglycan-binding domain-containing protein [Ruminococcaceae bacterium]|nr:LysM peptidoglycan-binding domain-containing protein [Oscillospiraceae bacterium]